MDKNTIKIMMLNDEINVAKMELPEWMDGNDLFWVGYDHKWHIAFSDDAREFYDCVLKNYNKRHSKKHDEENIKSIEKVINLIKKINEL